MMKCTKSFTEKNIFKFMQLFAAKRVVKQAEKVLEMSKKYLE